MGGLRNGVLVERVLFVGLESDVGGICFYFFG